MYAIKWPGGGGTGECSVGCADLIERIIIRLLSLDLFPRAPFPPSPSLYTTFLFAHQLNTISYFVCSPLLHSISPPSYFQVHTATPFLSLCSSVSFYKGHLHTVRVLFCFSNLFDQGPINLIFSLPYLYLLIHYFFGVFCWSSVVLMSHSPTPTFFHQCLFQITCG